MSSRYLSSLQSVRQWLGCQALDEQMCVLLDNGYDDLEAISKANQAEADALIALFPSPSHQQAVRLLVDCLRQIGYAGYSKQKGAFKRLIQKHRPAQFKAPVAPAGMSALSVHSHSHADPALLAAIAQTEAYLVQARSQLIGKTGYCAVRASSASAWSDKYVAVDGSDLKWFTSRRDSVPELVFPLASCLTSVDKPDPMTLVLSLANQAQIELGFDNAQETDEWFASFASVIPVARASLVLAQQKAAAFPGGEPTGQGQIKEDCETLEGAIALYSHYLCMLLFSRTLQPAVSAADLDRTLLGQYAGAPHLERVRAMRRALEAGAIMNKIKLGSAAQRLVWFTGSALVWGSEDRQRVSGFVRPCDMASVSQAGLRLVIARLSGRPIEFECRDANMAAEWKALCDYMIMASRIEQAKRAELFSKLALEPALAKAADEAKAILTTGDAFSVGHVTAPAGLERLEWRSGGRVAGFLVLSEVVDLVSYSDQPGRLTVVAKKRTLVMEGPQCERWARALRLVMEFTSRT